MHRPCCVSLLQTAVRPSTAPTLRKLIGVFDGDIGVHATKEAHEPRLAGIAQMLVEVKDVFDRLQQRIVIEGNIGNRSLL